MSMFWLPIFFLMGLVLSNNSGVKVDLLNIYCHVFVRIIILEFKIVDTSKVFFSSVFCRHH